MLKKESCRAKETERKAISIINSASSSVTNKQKKIVWCSQFKLLSSVFVDGWDKYDVVFPRSLVTLSVCLLLQCT